MVEWLTSLKGCNRFETQTHRPLRQVLVQRHGKPCLPMREYHIFPGYTSPPPEDVTACGGDLTVVRPLSCSTVDRFPFLPNSICGP